MTRRGRVILAALLAVLLAGSAYAAVDLEGPYQLKLVAPSAAQLLDGSPVWIDGRDAGEVTGLEARDGKAIVTVELAREHAPLREGTTSRVEWHSVLGERIVTIEPGPAKNPPLPSGALYEAQTTRIEVDEVLAAMDEPTRKRMTSLVRRLHGTVSSREADVRETLRSAGPAVTALGEILEAVGRDGPAIRELVTELNDMIGALADRREAVENMVDNTTNLTGAVAEQQGKLRDGLKELPATVRTATDTLDKVPAASRATASLLDDLRPATAKLPSVARNLSPVLADLRPTVARLKPTLIAMADLLRYTPGLIDSGHDVLPPASRILDDVGPALTFLRPYTPELVGWVTNWGQNFTGYDSQGHVWAGGLSIGPAGNDESAGTVPPLRVDERPKPGQAVGQPWSDAHGSGMR